MADSCVPLLAINYLGTQANRIVRENLFYLVRSDPMAGDVCDICNVPIEGKAVRHLKTSIHTMYVHMKKPVT